MGVAGEGPGSRVAVGVPTGWLVPRRGGRGSAERDVLIACG